MAKRLPQHFLRSSDSAIVSYNFTDIAEGTGIIIFNGFNAQNNSATTHHLTTGTFCSNDVETAFSSTTSTMSFNLAAFTLPKIIAGSTAVLRFSAALDTSSGSSGTLDFTATVQHVRGAVVTDIGTVTYPQKTRGSAGKTIWNLTATISLTRTQFKKDDILRLKIVGVSAGGIGYLGHDPEGRTGTGISTVTTTPTTLQFLCPFDISD